MVQKFAHGKYARITAVQGTLAKAPLDDTEHLVLPVMTQPDEAQTFINWSVSSTIETYDRSNTLSRTKLWGTGMSTSTITLNGLINPYASMGFFVGQYVKITIWWRDPDTGTDAYAIDSYCTITKIDKSGSVDDAFKCQIEAISNYSFDINDTNFVTLNSNTNPSDRGWKCRAPDLTQKLWSV